MVRIPDSESFGRTRAERELADKRVTDLERTDGSQYARALEKIKALIATLGQTVQQYVQQYIEQYSYTKTQIDSQHTAINGRTWPMGQISGMLPIGQGGTGSGNAYHQDLATVTRRAAWIGDNGRIGYALSTANRKANIQPAVVPIRVWLELPVQAFQYRDAQGDLTGWDLGFIAEDVAELGLEPWLYRGTNGELEGIAYERLPLVHHEALRDHEQRITDLEALVAHQAGIINHLSAELGFPLSEE